MTITMTTAMIMTMTMTMTTAMPRPGWWPRPWPPPWPWWWPWQPPWPWWWPWPPPWPWWWPCPPPWTWWWLLPPPWPWWYSWSPPWLWWSELDEVIAWSWNASWLVCEHVWGRTYIVMLLQQLKRWHIHGLVRQSPLCKTDEHWLAIYHFGLVVCILSANLNHFNAVLSFFNGLQLLFGVRFFLSGSI